MQKIKRFWYGFVAVDVRLTIYTILVATGIYYVYFDQTNYACNLPGQSCLFCGLKTAAYHLFRFRFQRAHDSNPIIWVFLALGIFLIVDSIMILCRFIQKKQQQ
jgi:hypothetical protein